MQFGERNFIKGHYQILLTNINHYQS